MGKTIEMYQDPKNGIYYTLKDLAERNGIRIITDRERYLEEISLVGIIRALQIPPMLNLDIFQYISRPNYQNKYQNESKYKQPEKTRPMPREIKHIVRRDHGRERK